VVRDQAMVMTILPRVWPSSTWRRAATPSPEVVGLDDHQALEYMRRILDQLAGDRSQA